MVKTLILTDSVSDISKEQENQYGIQIDDFTVHINGKDIDARGMCTKEEFYKMLEESNTLPTTSQISPTRFLQDYINAYKNGYKNILLILINSKGSGTFNNSLLAKELLKDENPEAYKNLNIVSLDGYGYTGMYGQIVLNCAEMLSNNVSFDEICNYAKAELPKRKCLFGMYSLKYASKSGRISCAAAFVASTLSIKPIMQIFNNEITVAKKLHGDKKMFETIALIMKNEIKEGSSYSIVYGSNDEIKNKMIEAATRLIGYPPINCYQICPSIAINSGPVMTGLIYTVK